MGGDFDDDDIMNELNNTIVSILSLNPREEGSSTMRTRTKSRRVMIRKRMTS